MLQRPQLRPLPGAARQFASREGGQRQPLSSFHHFSTRASPTRPRLTPSRPQPATSHSQGQRRSYYGAPPWHGGASQLAQGIVTWGFIGTNVLVWWKWQSSDRVWREYGPRSYGVAKAKSKGIWDMPGNFVLSARNLREGRWWTLLTHAISHQDGLHLAGNMISYYTFTRSAFLIGLGPVTVVAVGVGSALAAAAAGLADSARKGQADRSGMLGASGLVCGLGAFVTCQAPWLRFFVFPFPFPVPLWLLTSGYLAWDVYRSRERDTRVGHAAHVGGTVCGVFAFLVRRLLRF